MKNLTKAILLVIMAHVPFIHLQAQQAPKYEMKEYFLVLLMRGNNAEKMDSASLAKIQAGHMAHIQQMANDKKLAIAGPFLENDTLRGIFILDVPSREEAIKLCQEDPAVKAGRLKFSVRKWMSAKGQCLP